MSINVFDQNDIHYFYKHFFPDGAMTDAMLFDIDGTLIDHKKAQKLALHDFFTDHCADLDTDCETFIVLWSKAGEHYFGKYMSGDVSFHDIRPLRCQSVFSSCNVTLSWDDARRLFHTYLSYYERHWTLFDDVLPCIEKCEAMPMGVISNGDSSEQRKKLKATGLSDLFEAVVISEDIGTPKPSPDIFAHAVDALGTFPQETYYIGDDLHADVYGSANAGLKPVYLRRYGEPCPEDVRTSITSLHELSCVI